MKFRVNPLVDSVLICVSILDNDYGSRIIEQEPCQFDRVKLASQLVLQNIVICDNYQKSAVSRWAIHRTTPYSDTEGQSKIESWCQWCMTTSELAGLRPYKWICMTLAKYSITKSTTAHIVQSNTLFKGHLALRLNFLL